MTLLLLGPRTAQTRSALPAEAWLQGYNEYSSETRAASNVILFSNHEARGPVWFEHDHGAVAFESKQE